jgi:hypothetical protein
MFSFHKTDASRSRQSSLDSQATGPTIPTTVSDFWPEQYPMHSSHPGMHSPEQHRAHPARRSSVFNLRSRSNTATSITPSLLSLGQSDMADHEASWHGSPPGQRQSSNRSYKESIGSRRSLFRGKKGKRLSETPMINVNDFEGDASERRTSILRKTKRSNTQVEDASKSLLPIVESLTYCNNRHKPD